MNEQGLPEYPSGGDPARRYRLWRKLYGQRRVSRAFDRHLGLAEHQVEPHQHDLLDYRGTGLTLTVRGREHAAPAAEWRRAA